jgi:hypothetical protein
MLASRHNLDDEERFAESFVQPVCQWLRLLACIVCVVIDRAADVAVGSLHLAVTWCVGAAEHPCVQAIGCTTPPPSLVVRQPCL